MNRSIFFVFLFTQLLFLSCSDDDSGPGLTVNIVNMSVPQTIINWEYSGGDAETVFRILLNDEVIEEAFQGNQYTFDFIENATSYNGIIFAISQGGEETFASFSFNTSELDVWYGDLHLRQQSELDNFNYKEVTGELRISGAVTDLSNMSSLVKVKNRVKILYAFELTNLNGLENLTQFASGSGIVEISDCTILEDISALNGLAGKLSGLRLSFLPQINNFGDIYVNDGGTLILRSLNASSIPPGIQQTNTLGLLRIRDLPNLTSLTGLDGVTEIYDIEIRNAGIPNLTGFSNLTRVNQLLIADCNNLSSLDGTSLLNSIDASVSLDIFGNPELVDYCGLSEFANNVTFSNYNVAGNGYNPTVAQLRSETECRLP